MKNYLRSAKLILAFSLLSTMASAQLWTPVYRALDTTASGIGILSANQLRDFAFYDQNIGMVSFPDKYHLTNNGGASWSDSGYVQYFALGGITYVDSLTIFGYSGNRIIKSTDGGASFSLHATPLPSFSNSFIKIEGNFGLAVGQSCGIAYSNNAGATWTSLPSSATCANSGHNLLVLDILDSTTAFVGGESGQLLKTTDGGATWTRITPARFNQSNTRVISMDFATPQIGYVLQGSEIGAQEVHKTIDGGATWTVITPPTAGGLYGAIYAQDSNTIYLGADLSTHTVIYKSTNGGASYAVDFTTANLTPQSKYRFNRFKKAGDFLYVGSAFGGNTSSFPVGHPSLIKIFKRDLTATSSSLSEPSKPLGFSLAPNPANSIITITNLDLNEIASIAVYSIDGRCVKVMHEVQFDLDIADLKPNLYFLYIQSKDGRLGTAKFIKQ